MTNVLKFRSRERLEAERLEKQRIENNKRVLIDADLIPGSNNNQSDSEKLVHQALVFCEKGKFAEALPILEGLAEQGHVQAQCTIAIMYQKGKGVKKDYKKEIYWFTKAAEQGDVYAQESLIAIYYTSVSTEQDYNKAFYWCKKAAKQGSKIALKALPWIYTALQDEKENSNG